jgi:RNA polymerase sigma factor (sigma-70 family)
VVETPDSALLRARRALLVRGSLHRLPAREREVARLHYIEDRPIKDIARSFGVSEARVSQLHTTLKARLRAILGDIDRAA